MKRLCLFAAALLLFGGAAQAEEWCWEDTVVPAQRNWVGGYTVGQEPRVEVEICMDFDEQWEMLVRMDGFNYLDEFLPDYSYLHMRRWNGSNYAPPAGENFTQVKWPDVPVSLKEGLNDWVIDQPELDNPLWPDGRCGPGGMDESACADVGSITCMFQEEYVTASAVTMSKLSSYDGTAVLTCSVTCSGGMTYSGSCRESPPGDPGIGHTCPYFFPPCYPWSVLYGDHECTCPQTQAIDIACLGSDWGNGSPTELAPIECCEDMTDPGCPYN